MEHYDILIIGSGAAGITAAKSAYEAGCRSILLVDRKAEPGGILLQCAHRGFGPGLNGPEYVQKLLLGFPAGVSRCRNTTVLSIAADRTTELTSQDFGRKKVGFNQLILAAGCLEIPMGALPIAGTRPKGIYTAGQMQEMMNLHGNLPMGPVVILGSGDLGLIMAEHLSKAGLAVTLVEQRLRCGGMTRNRHCLEKPSVQLICGRTITEVLGDGQIEGVRLSDQSTMACKTLLIAAGLRPDRELIHGLGKPNWLHLCGNCNHVHPMIETVIAEGRQAGINAWKQICGLN